MTTRQAGIRLKIDGKTEIKRDLNEVEQAGDDAGQAIEKSFGAASAAATAAEKAAERQMARYKEMARAAREAENQQQQQAKFNAMLGVGVGGGKSARDSASVFEEAAAGGLTKQQRAGRLNLLRQGADVFTTAAMGMDPGMIAIQQGPQILDALATSGVKVSASMVAIGGSVLGVAGAMAVLGKAQADHEASTLKLTVAANGLGAASGQTAEQLEAQARSGAAAGDISVRSARDMAVAYAETGKIGGGVMDDLIALTKAYGLTTRQDAESATKDLGKAFADPAKGAADLNEKLHFLTATEEQHIQNLARSGQEAEAPGRSGRST